MFKKNPSTDNKKINILVIGGDGLLGRAIDKCSRDIVYSCFLGTNRENSRLFSNLGTVTCLSKSQCDVINSDSIVNAIVEAGYPAVIINCAGYTDVDKAEQLENQATAFNINANGPKCINIAVNEINSNRAYRKPSSEYYHPNVVYISSNYVYSDSSDFQNSRIRNDDNHSIPHIETEYITFDTPVNLYGKSKFIGEKNTELSYTIQPPKKVNKKLVQEARTRTKKFLIVRTAGIYGVFDNTDNTTRDLSKYHLGTVDKICNQIQNKNFDFTVYKNTYISIISANQLAKQLIYLALNFDSIPDDISVLNVADLGQVEIDKLIKYIVSVFNTYSSSSGTRNLQPTFRYVDTVNNNKEEQEEQEIVDKVSAKRLQKSSMDMTKLTESGLSIVDYWMADLNRYLVEKILIKK